ncbi:uncharacterized protein LOC143265068 [Megachile rotundata]|uniref:uncharacterized protein LOC143265068 n=1 Tax=Megachile rotundata TaxID=143995 RepID=UPI003FD081BD
MPKCNPRCPVVKAQLRKLATESPWVLKELATRSDLKVSTLIGTADEKIISATVDAKRDEDQRSSIDPSDPRYTEGRVDGKLVRRIRTSGTQADGYDPSVKTDISKLLDQAKVDKANGISVDRTDRASGVDTIDGMDRTDRASSASKLDKEKRDKETLKRELADKSTEFAAFRDECEQSCPRRISGKSRLRKLEETQCIIDSYLLNKGARYFEDVCTCSLSCVLRALRRDPFVTSTLASITIFTLGLKLCAELDAWYLPIHFS